MHRKLGHLALRLVIPITEIDLQVSFLITWNGTNAHLDLCFSRRQLRIPITSEKLNVQRHPEVSSVVMTLLAFAHDVPVVKRARRGTLLGGVQDDTEKFGPLKVVLGTIVALYANHEVRLKPRAQCFPFTNALPGNRCCRQQD